MHPYYTVALAPAVAASVAIGGTQLWRTRYSVAGRVGLVALIGAAGGWSYVLLARTSSWHPELRWSLIVLTVVAIAGVLIPARRLGGWARGGIVAGIAASLIGTGAFAAATAASPHTGSIPSVGPQAAQSSSGGMGGGETGSAPTGPTPGAGTRPSGSGSPASATTSGATRSVSIGGGGSASTSAALTKALRSTTSTWAAAVAGDQSAAELELSTGKAVIAIGGWSGSDNSPTLAQFKAYVAAGKVHYFVAAGQSGGGEQSGGGGQSSGVVSQITSWVKAHYTATTIGGQTVYDLTAATS